MANSSKPSTKLDSEQVLQGAYNEQDKSLTVGTFVTGKVGLKIVRSVVSGTVDDYQYFDGTTLLYTLRVTYNNTNHDEVDQVERIA